MAVTERIGADELVQPPGVTVPTQSPIFMLSLRLFQKPRPERLKRSSECAYPAAKIARLENLSSSSESDSTEEEEEVCTTRGELGLTGYAFLDSLTLTDFQLWNGPHYPLLSVYFAIQRNLLLSYGKPCFGLHAGYTSKTFEERYTSTSSKGSVFGGYTDFKQPWTVQLRLKEPVRRLICEQKGLKYDEELAREKKKILITTLPELIRVFHEQAPSNFQRARDEIIAAFKQVISPKENCMSCPERLKEFFSILKLRFEDRKFGVAQLDEWYASKICHVRDMYKPPEERLLHQTLYDMNFKRIDPTISNTELYLVPYDEFASVVRQLKAKIEEVSEVCVFNNFDADNFVQKYAKHLPKDVATT